MDYFSQLVSEIETIAASNTNPYWYSNISYVYNSPPVTINKTSCPAGSRCLVRMGALIEEISILEWSPSGNYVKYVHQGKSLGWTNKLPELLEVLTVLTKT